jgi:hypothetical protein
MSDVIVTNHITLDGVMQAPGRPDEDVRGGFEHGGWAQPGNDEVTWTNSVLLGGGCSRTGRRSRGCGWPTA